MANNRNRTVQCRLDDEEFIKLENLAEINGIKKSEVIRKSNIFKEYGRGGVLASMLDSYPSGSN